MTPFIKQPEINFGSKNSSFNKTVPPGTPVPMGSLIKPPANYSKLNNNDMPPPQNVQKLSKEVLLFFVKINKFEFLGKNKRVKYLKKSELMRMRNDN